jgi:hypothetical protein
MIKVLIVITSGDEKTPHTSHVVEMANEQAVEKLRNRLERGFEDDGVNGRDGIYYTVTELG